MKTALFVNFSDEAFTCSWDGKEYTFAPRERKFMQDFLAAHFAKHLANRELLKLGHENATSPKKPEQVPLFKEFFDKACIVDEDQMEKNEVDTEMELANKPETPKVDQAVSPKQTETPSVSEEAEEEGEEDESEENKEFEGLES